MRGGCKLRFTGSRRDQIHTTEATPGNVCEALIPETFESKTVQACKRKARSTQEVAQESLSS